MNADECVARGHVLRCQRFEALTVSSGCALQAAILSPFYKVQDFKVEDPPSVLFPSTCAQHAMLQFELAGQLQISNQLEPL